MLLRLSILSLVVVGLAGCATAKMRLSQEIAPQISTEVAVQVGTAVFEQVGAAVAELAQSPVSSDDGGAGQVEEEMGLVTRVIDGDTIDVMLNGVNTRIRYLQMNTPERDEPCYRESTQANADLVLGKTARLVADQEKVDRYDRLLRFIYVDDVNVNRALVEGGFAEVVLYPPNDARYDEFVRLEQEAAAAGRGCHPTGIFDDSSYTR